MTVSALLACRDGDVALNLFSRFLRDPHDGIRGAVTTTEDAVERTAQHAPDVLLLECSPNEPSAVAVLLEKITQASPGTRVLMLWDYYTAESLLSFIQHGVCGCLLKSSSSAMYAKAIISVHEGGTWFGRSELVEAMRAHLRRGTPITTHPAQDTTLLTPREREVLQLIGTGLSNKEIGRHLAISDQTVKTHLHHVYVKLERSGRYKAFLAHPAALRVANGAS